MDKSIEKAIDKALAIGRAHKLSNEKIEYLIKAIAVGRFGEDANSKLQKFNIEITDEDIGGIREADKFLGDTFEDFLDVTQFEKRSIVSDAIVSSTTSDIATSLEVAESLRIMAIMKWGKEAKAKLASFGLVTDEDLHNYMKEKFAYLYTEDDPDDDSIDYRGENIIKD